MKNEEKPKMILSSIKTSRQLDITKIAQNILSESLNTKQVFDVDPGNPYTTNTVHPAITMIQIQDTKKLNHIEGITIGNFLEIPFDMQSTELHNLVKNHNGELAGRGKELLLTPIYIRIFRKFTNKETNEFCASRDAKVPTHKPSWGASMCSTCQFKKKRNEEDQNYCRYTACVTCLAGEYNTLYKLSIKGGSINTYISGMVPDLKKCNKTYNISFLLTNKFISKAKYGYYALELIDTFNSNEAIVKKASKAREVVENYYKMADASGDMSMHEDMEEQQ